MVGTRLESKSLFDPPTFGYGPERRLLQDNNTDTPVPRLPSVKTRLPQAGAFSLSGAIFAEGPISLGHQRGVHAMANLLED